MSKTFQKYPTPANTSCNDTVFSLSFGHTSMN